MPLFDHYWYRTKFQLKSMGVQLKISVKKILIMYMRLMSICIAYFAYKLKEKDR